MKKKWTLMSEEERQNELKRRMGLRLRKYVGQIVTESMKCQILADVLHVGWTAIAEKMKEEDGDAHV